MKSNKPGRNDPCYCGSSKKYKKCCLIKDDNKDLKIKKRDEKIRNIDPRIFISKSFISCPDCGNKSFGVLMIMGRSFTRRCRDCWYDEVFKLPPIKKKLIYLDQFVISNIMKALDPSNKSHSIVSADSFWIETYKKLDKLSKYQLLICPDSFFHRHESLVGKDYQKMKRIYEHLSNGVTFYDKDTITRLQISEHFKNYLNGRANETLVLDPEYIINGRYNEWFDRIRISINDRARDGEIDELRLNREIAYEKFKEVFERWRNEKHKKFNDWTIEEAMGFGKGVWQNFVSFAKRRAEVPEKYLQTGKFDIDDVLPPMSNNILEDMFRQLQSHEIEGEKAFRKINDYFNSEYILQVPSIKIGSMLFAAIARKAVAGQVKPPSRGVFTDVNAISSFLPYCDAIFIDNENAAYLNEMPLKKDIKYTTKIFSTNTKSKFLDYLDSLLNEIDPEHLKLVKEVYGEDWGEPYLTILQRHKEDISDV